MIGRKPRKTRWLLFVMISALLAYVGCFPVEVWMSSRWPATKPVVERLYYPVIWESVYGPESISGFIRWWGGLMLHEPGESVGLTFNSKGGRVTVVFRK